MLLLSLSALIASTNVSAQTATPSAPKATTFKPAALVIQVSDTLGALLKYQDDIARLEGGKVKELLDQVQAELRAAE